MDARTDVSLPSVSTTSRTAWIAVGDVTAIAAFVVLGELSHGISPVADPLRVVETFIPFLIGWTVVGSLAGAYTPTATRQWRRAVWTTSIGWVGGALLGQTLRATAFFRGDAAPTFVLVSIAVGLALLVPWRLGVAYFASPGPSVEERGDQ